MCKIIVDVESYLTNFTLKVKTNIAGELSLQDFGDTGFMLHGEHEIIPKTKEELDIYQIEVKEVKERNEYLEEEMLMIKELYEDLVSKWQTASLRIIELEKDKEDIKSEYEHKIK